MITPNTIAILGYACRLPGACDVPSLWSLLSEGRCAVGPVPPERWSARTFLHPDRTVQGTTYSAAAGLIDDPFAFDPGFFGISPREAAQMDPQQRLLLLVGWEAIEMAGLAPERLAGPRTGVYVGASGLDYGNTLAGDPAAADAKFMTGNTLSILANRVAHVLDAQGPSYVIDTACSSSLFALHAACTAIEAGDIDVAIVGGVNMLLTPMPFVGFSRAAMLSPSGLCRPFDERADGYVRAEGSVAFVIARRTWAEAAGDHVRGLIVGTAINSDGRANALSVPNAVRQADLMRCVYGHAGIPGDAVAFIEAHGTGTAVGDPLEARAIGEAVAAGRGRPLPVGSIKSNIGHLEPAAGLAGLLKAQLALERGVLPQTLHIQVPNPSIPFAALNLAPATRPVPLVNGSQRLVAGVNAFGFGGANAHVAITLPEPPSASAAHARPAPLILSTSSEEALRTLARRWHETLEAAPPSVAPALVNAAATRRARLSHRLVVASPEREAQLAALDAFASGREHAECVVETALPGGPRPVAFVFSGNGSQWSGMGRTAHATDPAFRDGFDETAACVLAEGGVDLHEALHAADLDRRLTVAETAQPLLLALQVGLVRALAARGVHPAMVAGHSVGEVAAAWACGALALPEAARLAVRRARCQAPLAGLGGMAAVLAPADAVEALIEELGIDELAIAADNSPRGATVSGSEEAVEALLTAARARRMAVRRLRVDYPFHGPLMERIRAPLMAALDDLRPGPARVPFVSTATGGSLRGEALGGGYWWLNARNPVLFRQATLELASLGAGVFVEIGPQPTLQNYVTDTATAAGLAVRALPGFRRQGAQAEDAGHIAARVLAVGGRIDEGTVFGAALPMRHELPGTPWALTRYAFEHTSDGLNVARTPAERGLLGWRAAEGEGPWRQTLDAVAMPWLADHAVDGAPVMPAAGFVELALAAGAEALGPGPIELSDFDITRPLPLDGQRADLRTTHRLDDGTVQIEARPFLSPDGWASHARGLVRASLAAQPAAIMPDSGQPTLPSASLYSGLAGLGLDYGPAFRRTGEPEPDGHGGLRAALAPGAPAAAGPWVLDPTALDAAFHLLAPLLAAGRASEAGLCYLPVRVGRLVVHAQGAVPATVTARLERRGQRSAVAAFTLHDATGAAVATAEGVRFAAVRLGRRSQPDAVFWREESRRLRLDPDQPAALPAVWADPAERLGTLGLVSAEAPEPGAAALILDAACRRIAWDTARSIAPRGGVGFRARRVLPPGLARALTLGLAALAEDGAFDGAADRVAESAPVPSLESLIDALMTTAPDEAERMAAVLRLAAHFEARTEGERAVPIGAPVWPLATAAALDLCAAWPDDAALDVMLLGHPPVDLAARLHEAGAGRVEQAAAVGDDDWAAACGRGRFDVLIAGSDAAPDAGTLRAMAGALAPGGLVLAVVPQDHLLAAMLRAASGAPLPALPPDWARDTAAAGLVTTASLPAAQGSLRIMTARAAAAADTGADRIEPPVAILADPGGPGLTAAVALQEALSQGGRHARIVTDGAVPARGEAVVLLAGCCRRDATEPEALAARFAPLRAAVAAGDASVIWIAGLARDTTRPVDEALARIARVLANERPDLDLRTIQAAAPTPAEAARRLSRAILAPGAERSIMLRGNGAIAPRVAAAADVVTQARRRRAGPEAGLVLEAPMSGGLDGLRWVPAPRRAPGPGEIEIAVGATGLNFRDVMWGLGLLPEEAIEDGFAGTSMGMECAGTVVRAGPGARWREGERVMAFAAGAFATHVTLADSAAVAIPAALGLAEAASLPVAVATAFRALVDLGRIEAGETVLIHGAAGGVGLAAVQIARARGARVIATAGAPEKRMLLRLIGASVVLGSRGLDFAEGVMQATGGRGVDVALNSLSGEAMERTLACMAPFGRFIELGKRDYYANTRIGLRPMRRNIAYFGVDLDAMLGARPGSARPLLDALAEEIEAGRILPLPHRVFQGADVIEAFRLMQRAGHVGKIVVTPPALDTLREPAGGSRPLARPDGAWLVTGGTRGFGLALAERLASRGAGALWLASRSGRVADEDAPVLARMRQAGARVEAVACDVADAAQVEALLGRIAAEGPPLRGVAHAAVVLDDALFAEVTATRLAAAAAPKLTGAAHLDRLTRGLPIEHFLLFSSIAAMIGNPGQSAYVAANAGLEAIARQRRAAGLPALAVQWGPLSDTGLLAAGTATRALLERRGAVFMTAAQALDHLDTALDGGRESDAVLAIAPMRWAALAPELPLLATPLFERIDCRRDAGAAASPQADLRAAIAGLDETAALRLIVDMFRAEAAQILRQRPSDIDPARPLADMGFDSLMGVELKLSSEEKYGVTLPVFSLAEGATLGGIAARVLADLRQGAAVPAKGEGMETMVKRHLRADTAEAVIGRLDPENRR